MMSAGKKVVEPIMEAFESVGHHMVRVAGVTTRHRNKHDADINKRRQTDETQAGTAPSGDSGSRPPMPDTSVPGLHLKYKRGWSQAQRDAADEKVAKLMELASRGELTRVSPEDIEPRPSNLRRLYEQLTGAKLANRKYDVDHIIDLQLGGKNDLSNLWLLDRSVNRSLGAQIARQLRNLDFEDVIESVTITPR